MQLKIINCCVFTGLNVILIIKKDYGDYLFKITICEFLFVKYYYNYRFKEWEVGETCSMRGINVTFVLKFTSQEIYLKTLL
jgi:hypothetical protein